MEIDTTTPALRHHDWAVVTRAFQKRMVDPMIGGPEAEHPHLITRRSFYVEISRAKDKAPLFTDDKARLKTHLERTTGDRIAALEGIGKKDHRQQRQEKRS